MTRNAPTSPEHVPVLIAGGGPVGLSLAALLGRFGVRTVVIEADAAYCSGSRAICISRRSQEIFGWFGADQALLDKGLPWTGGRSFFRDAEVLHFQMPSDATPTLCADAQHPAVLRRGVCAPRRCRGRQPGRCALVQPRHRSAAAGAACRCARGGRRRQPTLDSGRLAGGLRRRAQHGARATRPGLRRHAVRRPLRHRRHRAGHAPAGGAAGLVRPAVQSRLDDPDAPSARQRMAHRLPDRATTKTRWKRSSRRTCCRVCAATCR